MVNKISSIKQKSCQIVLALLWSATAAGGRSQWRQPPPNSGQWNQGKQAGMAGTTQKCVNVRYGSKADIRRYPVERPLLGV